MHFSIHLLPFSPIACTRMAMLIILHTDTHQPAWWATILHSWSLIEVSPSLYTYIKSYCVWSWNQYPSRRAIVLAVLSLNLSPETYFSAHNRATDTIMVPMDPPTRRVKLWTSSVHALATLERIYGIPRPKSIAQYSVFDGGVHVLLRQSCAWFVLEHA